MVVIYSRPFFVILHIRVFPRELHPPGTFTNQPEDSIFSQGACSPSFDPLSLRATRKPDRDEPIRKKWYRGVSRRKPALFIIQEHGGGRMQTFATKNASFPPFSMSSKLDVLVYT